VTGKKKPNRARFRGVSWFYDLGPGLEVGKKSRFATRESRLASVSRYTRKKHARKGKERSRGRGDSVLGWGDRFSTRGVSGGGGAARQEDGSHGINSVKRDSVCRRCQSVSLPGYFLRKEKNSAREKRKKNNVGRRERRAWRRKPMVAVFLQQGRRATAEGGGYRARLE